MSENKNTILSLALRRHTCQDYLKTFVDNKICTTFIILPSLIKFRAGDMMLGTDPRPVRLF